MPTLSLYFPPEFADSTLAGTTYRLEIPRPDATENEYVLGRAADLSLTLAVRNISRRHCAISYSYAANRWAIQDLGSSGGTWLNSQRLAPYDWAPLAIGDKIHLSSNPPISIVEDEYDTVNDDGDDDGPATVIGTTPLNHITAEPALPTTSSASSAKTFADVAYLGASWLFAPTTLLGTIYRLIVLACAVGLAIVFVGGHQ